MEIQPGGDLSIDSTVRNKFRWAWLEEYDDNKDHLAEYVVKLNIPGAAKCSWCQAHLKYANGGKGLLKAHAKALTHNLRRNTCKTNQTTPASSDDIEVVGDCVSAIPVNSTSNNNHPSEKQSYSSSKAMPQEGPNFEDRKSHAEARTLAFVADHYLPITIVSDLIEYAKDMSMDKSALFDLAMQRSAAIYKLTDGFHTVVHKRLVQDLRQSPFSVPS